MNPLNPSSSTPETDEQPFYANDAGFTRPYVHVDFARKLERERDEALASLPLRTNRTVSESRERLGSVDRHRDDNGSSYGCVDVRNALQVIEELIPERDQLKSTLVQKELQLKEAIAQADMLQRYLNESVLERDTALAQLKEANKKLVISQALTDNKIAYADGMRIEMNRLRSQVNNLLTEQAHEESVRSDMKRQLAFQETELSALRKDKEIVDWLESNEQVTPIMKQKGRWWLCGSGIVESFGSLRTAIDNAIKESK